MKHFSRSWKSSAKPKKQRKYRHTAPLHIKAKLLAIHLSKDLNQKLKRRNLVPRTGDKVKIIKGDFKGKEGKIERIDIANLRIHVEGIERAKKDGTKSRPSFTPAHLILIEASMEDKYRNQSVQRGKK